jgi:protease-4
LPISAVSFTGLLIVAIVCAWERLTPDLTNTPDELTMTFLFRLISGFFKAIFLTLAFLRSLIFNLLFIALLIFVIYSLWSTEEVFLEDNTILKLSIAGDVVEQRSQKDPFGGYGGRFLGFQGEPRETVLQDILDGI